MQVLVDIGEEARARMAAIATALEPTLGPLGLRLGSGHQVGPNAIPCRTVDVVMGHCRALAAFMLGYF